jgi:hypothetical protein
MASKLLIAAVWIFHGLYSKLLRAIPRQEAIVAKVLGPRVAPLATTLIGMGEVVLGVWVLSGWAKVPCAGVQTAALVSMNALEILLAKDLLISATGMLLLNAGLLALVWNLALGGFRG